VDGYSSGTIVVNLALLLRLHAGSMRSYACCNAGSFERKSNAAAAMRRRRRRARVKDLRKISYLEL